MAKVVQAQLGEYRDISYYEIGDIQCGRGDYIVLSVDRGSEFGHVVSDIQEIELKKTDAPKGKVLRMATDGDLKQIENNRMKAKDALSACIQKISERKLDMQIVKAEYTFDSSKIIFTFTADGRVDFRSLVKDLARIFRVRIELRQIGVRDKAKIVSGFGVCGREVCCSSYMKSFHPLSIKMAKEQGLPLNPSRISGVCGRIKCCMAYEYLVYKQQSRGLPKVGDKVNVEDGRGRVIDRNILKRLLYVDVGEGKIVKVEIPKKDEKNTSKPVNQVEKKEESKESKQ